MYTTEEKPGKGQYECEKCGEKITLDKNSDELPSCPRCSGIDWVKAD